MISPTQIGDLTKQHGDFDADSTTFMRFEVILKRGINWDLTINLREFSHQDLGFNEIPQAKWDVT